MHIGNPPQLRITKPRTTAQSLHHLPQEIIEEILSRLPVKLLVRFRCVSESWRCLISNERFIKTHHQNIIKNKAFAHHKVIFNYRTGLKQFSLNSLLNDPIVDLSSFDGPMNAVLHTDRIVGCSNGLVCMFNKLSGRVLLCNPSTRISKELPDIGTAKGSLFDQYGFGWDELSGAYKVFVALHSAKGYLCKVYSSKMASWKTVESADFSSMYNRDGKFVSGKLHWCKNTRNLNGEWDAIEIVTFDLKSEVFGMMEQPYDPKCWFGHNASLGVLEECLSVLYTNQNRIDVWVMREYGVKESWVKVMAVPFAYNPYKSHPFTPLCIGLNGEILLMYGSSFLVYIPQTNVLSPLEKFRRYTDKHLYVESLVWPFPNTKQ